MKTKQNRRVNIETAIASEALHRDASDVCISAVCVQPGHPLSLPLLSFPPLFPPTMTIAMSHPLFVLNCILSCVSTVINDNQLCGNVKSGEKS